jgi:hypothetical protein
MNRILKLAMTILTGSGAVLASTIVYPVMPVDPKSTFLLTSQDSAVDPLFINLGPSGLNIPAASTINITAFGYQCYFTPSNACTPYSAYIGGVFDSNTTILPQAYNPANINRLPGAISSGLPDVNHTFLNTFYGNHSTTNPFDFLIPMGGGVNVTIPEGAQYLVVGILDSYFADNSGNPAVQITLLDSPNDPPPPGHPADVNTPEPGTYNLILSGIGGLMLLRGIKSRRRSA